VNLLAGRVVAAGREGASVEVAGHRLRAIASTPPAAGDKVRVVIRPETIELAPAGTTGVSGTVVARTFLGEKVEYQVRVGDEILQVTRPSEAPDARFAPGAAVTLRLPADGVGLLRENA
jgi:ABC-type Fe3+/spermidine/putrescine transport system ATPase subunit